MHIGSPTLVSMAQRACVRNIAGLKDVGDISYDLLRPILKKITNPQQLKEIEDASPHIGDSDAELWLAFIKRDIPQWQEKIVYPKNPRSWWKVYRKLIREEQKAKEAQEEQLRATMSGIAKKREENTTTYVQKVIQEPRTRQSAFVDGIPNPNVRCVGDSFVVAKKPSLKTAKTGKDILSAIRKQSANAQQQRGLMSVQPAKAMLPQAKRQITRAPESMVREYTTPAAIAAKQYGQTKSPKNPSPRFFVSRQKPPAEDKAINDALRAEQVKKEERLRSLAGAGSKTTSTNSAARTPISTAGAKPSAAAVSKPMPQRPQPQSTDSASPERSSPVLKAVNDPIKQSSPSPAPIARKRPAVSVFMPAKKRKT